VRALSFAVFFLVLSALVASVHYYLYYRLIQTPELSAGWTRAGAIAFALLALMIPVGLVVGRFAPTNVSSVVSAVVFTWFGFVIVLFFMLLTAEVVRLVVAVAGSLSLVEVDPDRRRWLARALAGTVGAAGLVVGGLGIYSALRKLDIQRVRVRLRRLPASMSGFRVVQLSDLHVGPTIGRAWLEEVVRRVNELSPDVIAITGDLVDGGVDRLRHDVEPLKDLVARDGVFFVTGNHEYYSGVDAWLAELTRLGVKVLRNERVAIERDGEGFDLAGIDDWSAKRFGHGHGADLAKALSGRDESRELILLAHQPKHAHEAAEAKVGLQLSGHTHGGQIFPWGYFVRLDQPFLVGLSKLQETLVYVSRGTGYWGPPTRIGATAEITLLELQPTAELERS
jgi:uncharacterized protein